MSPSKQPPPAYSILPVTEPRNPHDTFLNADRAASLLAISPMEPLSPPLIAATTSTRQQIQKGGLTSKIDRVTGQCCCSCACSANEGFRCPMGTCGFQFVIFVGVCYVDLKGKPWELGRKG